MAISGSKDLGGPEHARKAAVVPRRSGRCVAGPAEYGGSWIARSQISGRCKPASTGKASVAGAVRCAGVTDSPAQPSGHRAMPSEGIEGDELVAYVPLDTYTRDERVIAYGTRFQWRRRPRSSRRSHDLPRGPGEPDTGRRGPGDPTH